jgi:hypothetical protein
VAVLSAVVPLLLGEFVPTWLSVPLTNALCLAVFGLALTCAPWLLRTRAVRRAGYDPSDAKYLRWLFRKWIGICIDAGASVAAPRRQGRWKEKAPRHKTPKIVRHRPTSTGLELFVRVAGPGQSVPELLNRGDHLAAALVKSSECISMEKHDARTVRIVIDRRSPFEGTRPAQFPIESFDPKEGG